MSANGEAAWTYCSAQIACVPCLGALVDSCLEKQRMHHELHPKRAHKPIEPGMPQHGMITRRLGPTPPEPDQAEAIPFSMGMIGLPLKGRWLHL